MSEASKSQGPCPGGKTNDGQSGDGEGIRSRGVGLAVTKIALGEIARTAAPQAAPRAGPRVLSLRKAPTAPVKRAIVRAWDFITLLLAFSALDGS